MPLINLNDPRAQQKKQDAGEVRSNVVIGTEETTQPNQLKEPVPQQQKEVSTPRTDAPVQEFSQPNQTLTQQQTNTQSVLSLGEDMPLQQEMIAQQDTTGVQEISLPEENQQQIAPQTNQQTNTQENVGVEQSPRALPPLPVDTTGTDTSNTEQYTQEQKISASPETSQPESIESTAAVQENPNTPQQSEDKHPIPQTELLSSENVEAMQNTGSSLQNGELSVNVLQNQNTRRFSGDALNLQEYELVDILEEAIARDASDIHITVGYRAMLRVDGELIELPSQVMTNDVLMQFAQEFLKERQDIRLQDVQQVDVGYSFQKRRFRVNVFKQMGTYSVVARVVPNTIKTLDELGLPQLLKEFANITSGFVLVTGPTGSGKSTTLASVLQFINETKKKHIITLEDPVEFIFPKGNSLIDQRELGLDFASWPAAMRSMLRQDPDIVLVGEMRDLETIASAITVSETGHLVFATLHTNSASQTIDRIIDVFPEAQQAQIRAQLANVITAVVSQRLVPLAGGGRKAVMEVLIATPAVKNAIREGKTHQIDNMIQTGQDYGMISMEKSLVNLVQQGEITEEIAKSVSMKPDEIELLLGK